MVMDLHLYLGVPFVRVAFQRMAAQLTEPALGRDRGRSHRPIPTTGGWRCQSAVHLSDRIDFGSGMSRRLLLPSRPTPFRIQVMTFVHQEGGLRRITNRTLGNAKTRSGSTGGLRRRPSSLGWLVGRESETLVGDGQRCIRCGSDED